MLPVQQRCCVVIAASLSKKTFINISWCERVIPLCHPAVWCENKASSTATLKAEGGRESGEGPGAKAPRSGTSEGSGGRSARKGTFDNEELVILREALPEAARAAMEMIGLKVQRSPRHIHRRETLLKVAAV